MEHFVELFIAGIMIVLGPILTIFDLPGNTLLLITGLGLAFYDDAIYFNSRLMAAMILIYVLGEGWEFCISLFGIKRRKVSWKAVFFIGIGGVAGTVAGTLILPILGSFIGGLAGAFVAAFVYEYVRSGQKKAAALLAYEAAKVRFLALVGKLAAGILLAAILVKMVFFNGAY